MARSFDSVTCLICRKEFRAITVTHLRKAHGYKGAHPVRDYKRRFGLQHAMCVNSRKRHTERMERHWESLGQHWTPSRVIAEIRRVHKAGGSLRLTVAPIKLIRAGEKLFGSWKTAVEKAGLHYDDLLLLHRWNREKMIDEIRRLADEGVPLNATYISRHYSYLYHAAKDWFPSSWGNALRAAGFDPAAHKKPRGRWDKPQAMRWVLDRIDNRQSLVARDVPLDLKEFVRLRLKMGWADFVESFGIRYPGIKKRRNFWTPEKVLEEIRRLQAEGHAMNYKAVKRDYEALLKQATKYFKSWDAARAAAGG